jgi:hypothetical protein
VGKNTSAEPSTRHGIENVRDRALTPPGLPLIDTLSSFSSDHEGCGRGLRLTEVFFGRSQTSRRFAFERAVPGFLH